MRKQVENPIDFFPNADVIEASPDQPLSASGVRFLRFVSMGFFFLRIRFFRFTTYFSLLRVRVHRNICRSSTNTQNINPFITTHNDDTPPPPPPQRRKKHRETVAAAAPVNAFDYADDTVLRRCERIVFSSILLYFI
jgi:hypothetical protein